MRNSSIERFNNIILLVYWFENHSSVLKKYNLAKYLLQNTSGLNLTKSIHKGILINHRTLKGVETVAKELYLNVSKGKIMNFKS